MKKIDNYVVFILVTFKLNSYKSVVAFMNASSTKRMTLYEYQSNFPTNSKITTKNQKMCGNSQL